jgi:hypothetical protein
LVDLHNEVDLHYICVIVDISHFILDNPKTWVYILNICDIPGIFRSCDHEKHQSSQELQESSHTYIR